jgi:hypothetical protein
MIKFKDYLNEATERSGSLHVFDIDDTLFHTTAKIHVKNKAGQTVQKLSNSEYNDHKLPAGHRYDYAEFRSAGKFAKESKPILPMIKKVKAIHNNIVDKYPNSKIIMNTARTDFNKKGKFLMTFHKHGIPIQHIHVHRAGNEPGATSPGEAKNMVLRRHLNATPYKRVALYDDSHSNLRHFLKLRHEYPHTEFHAYHAKPDGSIQRMHPKDYENEKL